MQIPTVPLKSGRVRGLSLFRCSLLQSSLEPVSQPSGSHPWARCRLPPLRRRDSGQLLGDSRNHPWKARRPNSAVPPLEAVTHLHVQPLSPLPRVLDQQLQSIFVAPARLGRPQSADFGANVLFDARVDEVPRLHALSAESARRLAEARHPRPSAPNSTLCMPPLPGTTR